jgi:hypothetical protein
MRTRPFAFAAALCFAAATAPATAAAQQPATTGTSTTSSGATQDPATAQGDTSLVGQVQTVVAAARSGLTSVPVATATELLESIETKLRATGSGPLRSIAVDLRALRGELNRPTVSGRRVGVVLRRVGPKVTRVAATQSGGVRTALRELGSQLTTAGRDLAAPAAR